MVVIYLILFALIALFFGLFALLRWSAKIPSWLALGNTVNLMPVLLAPLAWWASLFLFENQSQPGAMRFLFGALNLYPFALAALSALSIYLFRRRNARLGALLPLVPCLAIYAAAYWFLFVLR